MLLLPLTPNPLPPLSPQPHRTNMPKDSTSATQNSIKLAPSRKTRTKSRVVAPLRRRRLLQLRPRQTSRTSPLGESTLLVTLFKSRTVLSPYLLLSSPVEYFRQLYGDGPGPAPVGKMLTCREPPLFPSLTVSLFGLIRCRSLSPPQKSTAANPVEQPKVLRIPSLPVYKCSARFHLRTDKERDQAIADEVEVMLEEEDRVNEEDWEEEKVRLSSVHSVSRWTVADFCRLQWSGWSKLNRRQCSLGWE